MSCELELHSCELWLASGEGKVISHLGWQTLLGLLIYRVSQKKKMVTFISMITLAKIQRFT